ncbi:ABC transporter ATP-binding domain-containing protein [Desulfonema limicola]|uniref:Transport permease protein n=1 Tax=Desulfonema limicola TaxID=45656 RepID=A0A975GH94_9BACT|nr:ABC transporter permease [Desulfonema limicola]QTA81176.1 ABC transporter ATP-binding domain-containing protein [Desulfonema limicola]
MIKGWDAIYFRELLILKRRLTRMLASMSVSPLLYLVAFGYAMGGQVQIDGHTYMEFLIPGLVAMSSMTQSFGIASEINISRFYWHIFEEFQAAPISNMAYVTGEVMAGMTRAFISVSVILFLGLLFGVVLSYNFMFWAAVFLNSFVFASVAVAVAMVVKSHADQAMVTNFIITPMAFLGGTFFPVDRLPEWAQNFLYFLPLTHAAKAIRAAAFGQEPQGISFLILFSTGCLCFFTAFMFVNRAKD